MIAVCRRQKNEKYEINNVEGACGREHHVNRDNATCEEINTTTSNIKSVVDSNGTGFVKIVTVSNEQVCFGDEIDRRQDGVLQSRGEFDSPVPHQGYDGPDGNGGTQESKESRDNFSTLVRVPEFRSNSVVSCTARVGDHSVEPELVAQGCAKVLKNVFDVPPNIKIVERRACTRRSTPFCAEKMKMVICNQCMVTASGNMKRWKIEESGYENLNRVPIILRGRCGKRYTIYVLRSSPVILKFIFSAIFFVIEKWHLHRTMDTTENSS